MAKSGIRTDDAIMQISIWLTFVALLAGAYSDDIDSNSRETHREWWTPNPIMCAVVRIITREVIMWSKNLDEPIKECVLAQREVLDAFACMRGKWYIAPKCLALLPGNETSASTSTSTSASTTEVSSEPTTISEASSTGSPTSGETATPGVRSRHLPAEQKHRAAHKHHLHHSAKSFAQHKDHQV